MTLHWWMHWFWITRPLAVAVQLICLLAAVQTIPLPASTLDPQVQSSHNSRTPPATSWVSGDDPVFTNDRPTSVYIEQHRQTAVYGGGPVWSSSPDIEEPFYPTTASSDHLSNRDIPTENIPITQKTISNQELHSETYRHRFRERILSEDGNPTELSSLISGQQSENVEDLSTHNSGISKRVGKEKLSQIFSHKSASEQPANSISYVNRDIPVFEEPHALSIELSPIVVSKKEAFSRVVSDFVNATPKIVDDRTQQKGLVSLNANQNDESYVKISTSHPFIANISYFNNESFTQNRKQSQRLVIRDLSNISEHVLSSVVSSHGSNSTDPGNDTSVRPSVRASKAIGSFPHSSAAGSSNLKKDHVTNPEKVEQDDKSVQNPVGNNDNRTISKEDVNTKSFSDNLKSIKTNHSNSNTSVSQFLMNSRSHSFENTSDQTSNRRTYIESGSSKLASDLNRTVHGISSQKVSQLNKEGSVAASFNSSFPNFTPNPLTMSTAGEGHKENSSSEPPIPFVSGMSHKITTLSDTEEPRSLTPDHNHEFLGRSASLSHDIETTVEPSIAPVSRSRVAASPDLPQKGLDAASITGIALGIVVFAGLTGAVSFILYRRRYLNKPQTLNDKCSNPDSSGYIDDSTLRENSEEMYSLDNDSFLNSLEAMTIQNYWTDNETCWRQNRP